MFCVVQLIFVPIKSKKSNQKPQASKNEAWGTRKFKIIQKPGHPANSVENPEHSSSLLLLKRDDNQP
jgi:hypothetical protein